MLNRCRSVRQSVVRQKLLEHQQVNEFDKDMQINLRHRGEVTQNTNYHTSTETQLK